MPQLYGMNSGDFNKDRKKEVVERKNTLSTLTPIGPLKLTHTPHYPISFIHSQFTLRSQNTNALSSSPLLFFSPFSLSLSLSLSLATQTLTNQPPNLLSTFSTTSSLSLDLISQVFRQ
ncbi:hypothetical protein RIF29_17807 [Crotalaria pallida]|uniref:Uncharacterized protein n=1 Tax=Crotalaria pallida TaxID=3830 RepID=A0AAN9FRJ4_CROPI